MQTYSHGTQDYEYSQDSQMDYGRDEKGSRRTATEARRPKYSRSGARPAVCNGIHRRRNKRWSW